MLRTILIFLLFASCTLPGRFEFEVGDILFQDIDCGPLCDAIEQVTQGIDGAKFSHVAIIIDTDSGLVVLEAISQGVVCTSIDSFLDRSMDEEGNPKVLVGRLKKEFRKLLPDAISDMKQYLGSPYDTVFDLSNQAYYCSELLYFGFAMASNDSNFFKLNPMTYKAPGEEEFFPEWADYFNSLGVQIPENLPGLNPGSISRSDKIEIVYAFGFPDGYKEKLN